MPVSGYCPVVVNVKFRVVHIKHFYYNRIYDLCQNTGRCTVGILRYTCRLNYIRSIFHIHSRPYL